MLRLMAWMLAALAVAAPTASAASLDKLDGSLRDLRAGVSPGKGALRQVLPAVRNDAVAVDVYAEGDLNALARSLRALGMRVDAITRGAPQRMLEGTIPVDALDEAAALGRVRAIVPVEGSGTNAGSVTSQGDASHHGPQARALGPNGAGVVVGIVSDSIDRVGQGVAGSQASGDLPATVDVLDRGPTTGSDEGRAMAEIVYDTAPGIPRMVFHTGSGAANRATGIDELVAAGAKVIADDTFQITEPFFQDGVVAQAVDRAKAAGVTYVVSAGNRARQSWEGTYSGGGDHDFGAGDTVQTLGSFTVTNRNFFISLQWDEPWGAAETNLAIDVYNLNNSSTVPALSTTTDNIATGLPSEFLSFTASGNPIPLGIGIRRVAGTRSPFMKYIVGGAPTFTIAEHNVPTAGAIDPDASSALGAITVGAVNHATNATPESFSSRGPAFRLFDDNGVRLGAREVRPKPDIAGADGVSTSVPGFQPFFGTSAAAPSVAGVAALIKSVRPSMSPDQVAAALEDTGGTVDCAPAGSLPDLDCGFGFPLADVQVQELDRTPPSVTNVLAPGAPDGRNGFYTAPVNVSWNLADADSPIYGSTGCAPVTVTADGPTTLSCEARSLGGTFKRTVTFNRDGSPPSAPAIAGIAARSYKRGKVPSAISCTSADPTSGATCAVAGRSTALGRHTITATATNGAGLTSSSQLAYSVAAAKVTKVSRRGRSLRYTVDAAGPVTITLARKKGKKFKRVKRLKVTAKVGKNAAKLPKLRSGTYRVTVLPAGGKPRTKTFKKP